MSTGEGVEEGGGGGGGGVLGTSAGTIVWVRRRNGSWWPGRILGPEELPTSHLMSPRSGTPVKLLGREDASVDWYNLEKSKRVKAFRCGEFDACIERAEASLGFPIKKREKYARREDAILHALELEKQQKQGMLLNCLSDKSSLALQKESNNFSSEVYTRNDELGVHIKHTRNKSQTLSGKVALPHEEENTGESLHAHNKNTKQSSWEDVLETIPRMRGLQDFGLRIASSRRKTVPWETSQKLDDIVANYPSDEDLMGGASYAGGNKGLLSIKKKRSYGGMPQESLGKRRDRRRPLNQVLQSSAKLSVTHSLQCDHDAGLVMMEGGTDQMDVVRRAKKSKSMYLPASSNDSLDCLRYPPGLVPSVENQFGPDSFGDEYTFSGLVESDNSYSSESRYLEPDADEEVNLYTGMETLEPGSKDAGRHINYGSSSYLIPDELANVDTDEMGLMIPQFPHHVAADASAEVGVSKWHIKGKRNVRNIAKRPIDAIDGKKVLTGVHKSNGFAKAKAYESKRSSFKMEKMSHFSGFYDTKEDNSIIDADLAGHSHLTGLGGRRYSSIIKAGKCYGRNHSNLHLSNDDSHVLSPSGWEADGPSHMARRSCWLESEECFDPVYSYHLSGEMEPMLVDVDLKVQAATYQGEHVPLVSLMSRLNGKAIVGHPVQIEISEDGSTAQLVSGNDVFPDDSIVSPPVWRTARRTAMQRVPRSNPGSSALDSDDAEQLHFPDTENKTLIKRPYSVRLNHQSRLAKMSHSQTRQSVSGRFQKKLPKREGLSSQKIRTLSSIATDYRLGGENVDVKLSKDGGILSGLIKPEETVPLVTCVPLKVVFSRILEAVGRPSSVVAHRVRMASSAVRDPS